MRLPYCLILKGSVIPAAITQTLTVTIIAAIVTIINQLTDIKMSAASKPTSSTSTLFTSIIGIVVGLLLVFRTNTGYDRYWEGRKVWSSMAVYIRHLTRYIWVGVREDGRKKDDATFDQAKPELVIEKRTVLNLLLGFSVAVKHYLRSEIGFKYDDLEPLVSNIQATIPKFRPITTLATTLEEEPENAEEKVGFFTRASNRKKVKQSKHMALTSDHNLPLDIILYLSSYCNIQFEEKRIDAPILTQLLNNLGGLCDCLTQFERILTSPIPLAYSIHLSQCVWVYCITLPFFLIGSNGWVTIPIVFFVSFILFGLERIGTEIENPFGYDSNDLDLDDFCSHIRREMDIIASHAPPTIHDWVYAPENFPFENMGLSAIKAANLSVEDLRSQISASNPGSKRSSFEIKEEKNNSEEKNTKLDDIAVKLD